MPKFKLGAVTIDLVDGSIHGDLDHCPKEDLLESAQALLSLLPRVKHKGLWGLGKAYDADCYLYTAAKRYSPTQGLVLEADCLKGSCHQFRLMAIDSSDRETHWRGDQYSHLIGSVRDGQVSPDTDGLVSHYVPRPPRPTEVPKVQRERQKTTSSSPQMRLPL